MDTQPPPHAPQIQTLLVISSHLQLTHVRNKNQHRLSKWYKSFSQLRRQIPKLVEEIEVWDRALKFSSSGDGAEGKYVKAARERVEGRLRFWEERLVERWYLAFGNLVADNQYAALGLMLIGTLAKVSSVMRELRGEGDDDGALEGVGEEQVVDDLGGEENDLGEVVSRDEIEGNADQIVEARGEGEDAGLALKRTSKKEKRKSGKVEEDTPKAQESRPAKKAKKKRKKGDAFDDLFDSLL